MVVNATPPPLYPRERRGNRCIGCSVCSRTVLEGCRESRPLPKLDPRTVQPVGGLICKRDYRTLARKSLLPVVCRRFNNCFWPTAATSILFPLSRIILPVYVTDFHEHLLLTRSAWQSINCPNSITWNVDFIYGQQLQSKPSLYWFMSCRLGWQMDLQMSSTWRLIMGQIGRIETSVTNCQPTPRNIAEQRRP